MAPRHSSSSGRLFVGRTRLVTVISIAAVGLAGATAVGANIGILSSASDSPVGSATIAGEASTTSAPVVDVLGSEVADEVQRFAVDVAGTVALITVGSELRLDDVFPAAGWTWTLVQGAENSLRIIFTDGKRTLEFTATSADDGSLTTFVGEPVSASEAASCQSYDEDHDSAYEDDDEIEADEATESTDASEEYEGLCDDD